MTDAATYAASAAVLGTIVGAGVTLAGTYLNAKAEDRRPACAGATIMGGLDAELAAARQGVARARTRLAEPAAQPSRQLQHAR